LINWLNRRIVHAKAAFSHVAYTYEKTTNFA